MYFCNLNLVYREMSSKGYSLGETEIFTLIRKFTGPAVLGLLVNALYNIVDRILVGQFIGTVGLSAVTLVYPVVIFQFGLILFLGSGAGVIISKFLGESNIQKAQKTLGTMIAGILILIVVFTSLGLLFYHPLLRMFGAQGQLLNLSADYLRILVMGFPFSFFIALEFTVRAEGNPRLPAISIVVSSFTNIILDVIFMKGFNMGVSGAALATVIAQMLNVFFLIYYYVSEKSVVKLLLKNIRLQKKIILPILISGFAPFIMDIGTSIQNSVANKLLLDSGGSTNVAAMGIIYGVNIIFLMTAFGIGDGMQPIISFNYGAKKSDRTNKTLLYALGIGESLAILAIVIIELFPLQIAHIFIGNDAELTKIIEPALKIFALSIPFYMVQIIATRYFQAIHKQKLATFMALLRPLILFIPIVYLLNWFFGLNGIWFSFVVSDSIAALISFIFLKKSFNENKCLALKLLPNAIRNSFIKK